MNVTNPRLNRLINVICKYLSKLLTLVDYTALLTLILLDNHPNTRILITIFIILFLNKKVGLSGFLKSTIIQQMLYFFKLKNFLTCCKYKFFLFLKKIKLWKINIL